MVYGVHSDRNKIRMHPNKMEYTLIVTELERTQIKPSNKCLRVSNYQLCLFT